MADSIQRNHSSSSIHRNRSSSSIHDQDHQTNRPHKPKQFHVARGSAASRHHTRVPSFGRNLNKLGGASGAGGKALGTSPKDKPPRSAKRPTFELGDDDNGSDSGSYKEASGFGNNAAGGGTGAAVRPASLVKSNSTRSLDRESRSRKATTKARSTSRSKSQDRRARKDRVNSSDALTTMATNTVVPAPQLQSVAPMKPLTPQHTSSAAASTSTGATLINVNQSLTHAPITPAHSLPSSQEQPLTSRFMQSPNTPVPKTPPEPNSLPRSDSVPSFTSTNPSRTQLKVWLQRAESQQEIAPPATSAILHPHRPSSSISLLQQPGSEWYLFQNRAQREFDRVAREYMNVRRFENPLIDGLERQRKLAINQSRIPNGKGRGSASGSGLGLSQSLKEASSTTLAVGKGRKQGAKDDSGIVVPAERRSEDTNRARERERRQDEVEHIIKRLWRGELLTSNE